MTIHVHQNYHYTNILILYTRNFAHDIREIIFSWGTEIAGKWKIRSDRYRRQCFYVSQNLQTPMNHNHEMKALTNIQLHNLNANALISSVTPCFTFRRMSHETKRKTRFPSIRKHIIHSTRGYRIFMNSLQPSDRSAASLNCMGVPCTRSDHAWGTHRSRLWYIHVCSCAVVKVWGEKNSCLLSSMAGHWEKGNVLYVLVPLIYFYFPFPST